MPLPSQSLMIFHDTIAATPYWLLRLWELTCLGCLYPEGRVILSCSVTLVESPNSIVASSSFNLIGTMGSSRIWAHSSPCSPMVWWFISLLHKNIHSLSLPVTNANACPQYSSPHLHFWYFLVCGGKSKVIQAGPSPVPLMTSNPCRGRCPFSLYFCCLFSTHLPCWFSHQADI